MPECKVCGIEIVLLKSEKRNRTYKKKFCSSKCRARDAYLRRYEYYKDYWKTHVRGLVEATCKICGNKFMSKSSNHYTCSKECSEKLLKFNRKNWKKNNRNKVLKEARDRFRRNQKKKVASIKFKVCPFCKKEFNPYNTGRNPYKTYCSKTCQQKFNSRKQTKERNELLKNPDFSNLKYVKALARKRVQDANYKAFARGCTKDDENHISLKSWLEIKELHNNKCADCGKKENDRMKLTVDHIYPISKGGKNNKDNIQPLCKTCNCKKQAKIISIPHTS